MGRFDERKQQLGIAVQQPQTTPAAPGSRFDRRRQEIDTQREQERQAALKKAEQPRREMNDVERQLMRDTLSGPSFSRPQQVPQATSLPAPGELLKQQHERFQPEPEFKPVQASPLAKLLGADKKPIIGPSLTQIAEMAGKDPILRGVTRGAAFGLGDKVMPQRTGKTPLSEKIAEFVGMLQPGAAAERVAASVLRPIIGKLPRAAQFAARGAGAGVLHGGATETAQELGGLNDQTLGQRLLDVGIEAAAGGALGAATDIPRALANKAKDVAEGIVGRNVGTASAIESASASVPTGRLRVQSNTERLNKLLEEIKPDVDRLTQPPTKKNDLARWLQPHLGDVSMNELRKLSQRDLDELAAEVLRDRPVIDVARQAAADRGQDLDAMLGGKVPNFKKRAEELRMAGVAGAVEPPQNVKVAIRPSEAANPTAAAVPENKESWFTKLFGNQGVGITPGVNSGKEMIDTHIVQYPKEKGTLRQRAGEKLDTITQEFIDRFAPFRKVSQETYDTAMDTSRANNLANVTIKDKFVDLEGNVVGDSLKDVYAQVPRGKKHIADRYVIARDAVSRMDRNIRVYGKQEWFPQTSQEAEALVQKLETQEPWLKGFGESWNQFNRNRQDLWVQSGIVSEELINTLRFTNPNYAPMFRQMPRGSLAQRLAMNSQKVGFSNQKAPIKRAKGGTGKIIEPAQGMIETTASSYHAMLRNRAMQSLYKAVEADPEKYQNIIKIVDDSADARATALKSINDALAENGPDGVADMLNGEIDNLFKKAQQSSTPGKATVTVLLDGVPRKLEVSDPSLLKAIEGIAPERLEGILRIADVISRGIKIAATGLLAPFQGVRLALRDLPIAFTQSDDKLRFIGDVSHALISHIGDWLPDFVPGSQQLGKLAREYYRAGGGYEAYLKGDSRIRATASDITRDPILSGRNMWKTAKAVNPLRPLKGFGDAMENVPRMAAFAAKMRETGWSRDPEAVRRALDAGREATVNWSRKGAKGTNNEAVFPYANAAIQGTYRVVKRFREQPVAATALIAAMAGAKIYAYEKFKDDPDYQQRSEFEKGIPISKTADGKFVTIPIEPTEGYIADQVLNFYKWAKDQESFGEGKKVAQDGLDAFLPSYLSGPASALTTPGKVVDLPGATLKTFGSSIGDPLSAAATGKNYFGGDIIPREYQGDPKSLQYNETTSAAGKWAAENLGMDAFTFDYLGQKLGGDIAKIGLPMTSDVGKGDPTGNFVAETLARLKLLEDPVMKNNISNDFYQYARGVTEAKAMSDRKGTPLPKWYEKAYDNVTSTKKGSISKQVSALNTQKKEVQRDTTLTAKQRADKLRDIQREINLTRLEGIRILQQLGVPKSKER